MSFVDVQPRIWGQKSHNQQNQFSKNAAALEQEEADKEHLRQVLSNIHDRKEETGEVLMTMDEEEFLSRMIREREEAVKEVAAQMAELKDLMQDVYNLVHEQGFMVGS
jgi:5-formyltetrahydrofolate cyclo-ligase